MVALPDHHYISPDEYLALEAQSPTKHEYHNGEVFEMAGAVDEHVTVAGNLFAMLLLHLRGSGCRVYISDMKAKLARRGRFFYPDVMVTCDRRDSETALYKTFPKLIVEVLSDSTEAYDRGDKFADCQTVESLEEYVLVSPKRSRIECFRRGPNGVWILHTFVEGTFELASVGFEGAIEDLYENVVFPEIDR
jgi:Uma2 family endonuclease